MNLFEVYAKLGLDSSEYESGLTAAERGIGKLETAVKAFVVGKVAQKFMSFMRDAVSTGMQFDSAMSQVAATMGVGVDEITTLREFAMDMGAKTVFSATQAAEALNYMALAGYDAEKSMAMLPTVLNLAAAGGMDLATASDMVTDAESALGLTTEETSRMVDQMARTASRSNTSVSQLGDAMLTIGGTANFMAGGTDRLQTVLGLLADNGIKGSEAGTHLRNMLLKLSAPTDNGAKLMKELGVNVFDAEGNMRDMQDIMLDLNGALSTLTAEGRVKAISEIFNARDLSAVNALLNTSKERWDELGATIAEASGSAEQMAGTQLGNLTGDITLMRSALEGVKIQFSDGITPALRDIIQRLTRALSSPKTQKFLHDVGAALGDILKRVLSIVSNKVLPFLVSLFDNGAKKLKILVGVVGGAVAAFKATNTVLGLMAGAVSPTGLLIKGLGLLAGAIGLVELAAEDTDYELQGLSKEQRELVESAREAAKAYEESVATYNESVAKLDTDMSGVQSAWNQLAGMVDENGRVAEGYEGKVQLLIDKINEGLGLNLELQDGVIQGYQDVAKEIDNVIAKKMAETLLDLNKTLYDQAVAGKDEAMDRLIIAQDQLKVYQKQKSAAEEALRQFEKEHDVAQDTRDLESGNLELIELAHTRRATYFDDWNKLKKAVEDANMAYDSQRGTIAETNAEVDKFYGDIKRYEDAYVASAEGNYEEVKRLLTDNTRYRWENYREGQAVSEAQLKQMQEDYDNMEKKVKIFREKYSNNVEGYTFEMLMELEHTLDDMGAKLKDAEAVAKQEGKNFGSGYAAGIKSMKDSVWNAGLTLVNNATAAIQKAQQSHSPSKVSRKFGRDLGTGYALGIEDEEGLVGDSAGNLVDAALGGLDNGYGYDTESYVERTDDGMGGANGLILGVLRDIRDNMDFDVVLNDGTIAGRIDKLLGQAAMRKARGNA